MATRAAEQERSPKLGAGFAMRAPLLLLLLAALAGLAAAQVPNATLVIPVRALQSTPAYWSAADMRKTLPPCCSRAAVCTVLLCCRQQSSEWAELQGGQWLYDGQSVARSVTLPG